MKILVAEDDPSLRRALVSILQKNRCCVDAVDNGGDALDYLRSDLYDAAILDIMMPLMDGVSVLIRAREAGHATPVLLLTAKSGIDDKIAGLDAGANDYLTKPFDMRELLARLRALTRRQDDRQGHRLHRAGHPLLRAVCAGWQLPAGRQGIPDDAAVHAQSRGGHPADAVP